MSGNETLINLGSVLVRIGQELMKEGQPKAGGASKQPDPTPKDTLPVETQTTPPANTGNTELPTNTPPASTGDGPSRTIAANPTAEDIRACFAHLMQLVKPAGEAVSKSVANVVGRIGQHMECAKLSNLQKPEKKVQAIRYGLFLYDTAKAGGADAVLNVKFDFEGGPQLDPQLYPLPSTPNVDNSQENPVGDVV